MPNIEESVPPDTFQGTAADNCVSSSTSQTSLMAWSRGGMFTVACSRIGWGMLSRVMCVNVSGVRT